MKRLFTIILNIGLIFNFFVFLGLSNPIFATNKVDDAITNTTPSHMDSLAGKRGNGINEFIYMIAISVFFPIAIIVGVIVAIIGFYKLMMSNSEEEQTKSKNFLIWGSIGVMIMFSAKFIANSISKEIKVGAGTTIDGVELAFHIYDNIIFPFLKIFIFIIIGVLFIILCIHAYKFLLSPSDDIKKHSRLIIVWNVIGIIFIMSTTQIVELIYGNKQSLKFTSTNIGSMGEVIFKNYGENGVKFVTKAIDWFMGLIAFILLGIIIYQSYIILVKPHDTERLTKLKRSLIYMFIGLMVIGGGYLVTSFLIVNPNP